VKHLAAVLCLFAVAQANSKQLVPDPKRQAEIRKALVEHGYPPGRSWHETQEILREIARVHHWPHNHAPDVKTLIYLGLGNRYSDPSVLALDTEVEDKAKP
jgi:hypothetical protein